MPANGGSKLESDPEYIKLIYFLIERTKDAKSPLNVIGLAREYKETSGSSQKLQCLHSRIHIFRLKIHQMDSIDTETKVKMIFALSVPIDNQDFLNELRKNALVEVDERNRITKYKANDGNLELEKLENSENKWESDPKQIELMKFLIEKTKDAKSPLGIMQLAGEFKETSESSQTVGGLRWRIGKLRKQICEMDSIDTEAKVKMLFALGASINEHFLNERRSALKMSVKKELPTESSEIVTTRSGRVYVFMKSKKKSFGDEEIDHYHDSPLQKKRKTGSMSSRRIPIKQEYQDTSRTDVKSFRRYIKKELMNPIDKDIQREAPVKVEDPMEVEDVKPKFTSKLKFLEAIKSLVDSLDTPTLSRIQSKIQQKIWKTGHSNFGISNDEMIPAMDLLVARIANHSFPDLSETDKSVSFKEFLCYLKAVILNSKLEGLEGLLEKIKEKNKTLALRDKRVPVEKVASFLQDTLNNVGF
ncbi:hypothetical protein CAEBREN_24367 [Caenorhabditis brenneri]|uniref:SPK domain-containing protein n=1 Tax=Caenorhabditis brenneri TaxID=135651 RepID=G0P3H0_CAEBE|nr:hypothetical protein CAEBREN_24367 [Caenorhabditis brenneri]